MTFRKSLAAMAVVDTVERLAALRLVEADLREAGGITHLDLTEGESAAYMVTLATLAEPES